ncbi:MAG: hypothetical protein Q9177_002631 [Variospora cf. flavescens]
MVQLSEILPRPVYRWLQKTVGVANPPKAKQEDYLDLFVLLRVSRNVLPQSLHHLKQLVGSFHDNNPPILRCEVHCMDHDEHACVVNMLLRFGDRALAPSLTVDGTTFQDWLVKGEEGGFWECGVYEHDIDLITGYDRGGSGRTILLSNESKTRLKQSAVKKKDERRKKKGEKKTSNRDRLENKVVAAPVGIQEIEMLDLSEVRHGDQTQVDDTGANSSGSEGTGGEGSA